MINEIDRERCIEVGMPIVSELRRRVKRSGLNQTQISELAGIPQGTISIFMNYDRDFSFSTIMRIAKALGLEIIVCVD